MKSPSSKTPISTFSLQNSNFRFKCFFDQNPDFVLGYKLQYEIVGCSRYALNYWIALAFNEPFFFKRQIDIINYFEPGTQIEGKMIDEEGEGKLQIAALEEIVAKKSGGKLFLREVTLDDLPEEGEQANVFFSLGFHYPITMGYHWKMTYYQPETAESTPAGWYTISSTVAVNFVPTTWDKLLDNITHGVQQYQLVQQVLRTMKRPSNECQEKPGCQEKPPRNIPGERTFQVVARPGVEFKDRFGRVIPQANWMSDSLCSKFSALSRWKRRHRQNAKKRDV